MAMLWERLLSGGFRTTRPEEADYFFVPAPMRACSPTVKLMRYLEGGAGLPVNYLARNGGQDHLIVHTGGW